ncbi:DUF6602 domain-containing protein [Rhizobium laguerreae]|uniref:DUF6602 domain-containing protein n=1 Tax=Rhizobium laguerreae TaxID=1076926 RepID=UPI001C909947|nr:DUF6602 domain-containing protein [Rhizobium laguerreae]MBY3195165.1 hypothetical protein [Rhizobium laguerreae]
MVDFPAYFSGMEAKLRAELDAIRAVTTHAGNKGNKAEQALRTFLNDHLPRSIEVGHGEAIDKHGNAAGDARGGDHQIDVLIINDSHPRFGKVEEPNTYFIEGILAGGEVKASLQMGQMEAIFKQAVAFKKLNTFLNNGDLTCSNDTDIERFLTRRPYFLFAYESAVKPEALVKRVLELEHDNGVGATDHLDAIFMLGHGSIFNLGDGKSSFMMLQSDGAPITGWGVKDTASLMPMIGWLSAVMPNIVHLSSIALPYLVKPHSRV